VAFAISSPALCQYSRFHFNLLFGTSGKRKDDMKEVKIFWLDELTSDNNTWFLNSTQNPNVSVLEQRQLVEERLAEWLSAGWRIEGAGGEQLNSSYVIMVRDR
jgi:hypothetical protein